MNRMRQRRVPRQVRPMVRAIVAAFTWIETERLVIRRVTAADSAGLALTMDTVVLAANGWTPQHAANFLTGLTMLAARGQMGARAVITSRTTGEILGEVSGFNLDPARCSCEIGWWTGPSARRQGYGTEAAAAVVRALHAAGLRRIWIGTAPDNAAVQRTAARIGARLVGNDPQHRLPDGTTTASLWFAHDA